MNGTFIGVDSVAKKGSFWSGKRTRMEVSIDVLAEVVVRGFLRKLWVLGSEERLRKPFLRIHFSFGKARTVGSG